MEKQVPQQHRPNFLLGGTSAGGTSYLSAILVQHPQIYLPKQMRPEPHFYYKPWEYEKGLDYYFSKWFKDVPDSAIAVGERSSSYLFGGSLVASKIASDFPNMKFIFTLRNPIERTWANYRYTVLQGLEDLSFEEALDKEQERVLAQENIWAVIQPYNYTGRGFYAEQIEQFLEFFPRENLLFIKSELLSSQTKVELDKICRFLNLSKVDFDYMDAPNHTSVNVLDPALQGKLRKYFADRFDKVIEVIRKEENMQDFPQKTEDKEYIELLKGNLSSNKLPMPQTSRKYLQEVFDKDIQKLQGMIDFTLLDWK